MFSSHELLITCWQQTSNCLVCKPTKDAQLFKHHYWQRGCHVFEKPQRFHSNWFRAFKSAYGLESICLCWGTEGDWLEFVSNLEFCDLPGMSIMFQVSCPHAMVNRVDHNSWEDVWKDFICPCVGTKHNMELPPGSSKRSSTLCARQRKCKSIKKLVSEKHYPKNVFFLRKLLMGLAVESFKCHICIQFL